MILALPNLSKSIFLVLMDFFFLNLSNVKTTRILQQIQRNSLKDSKVFHFSIHN